ncbi:MAG: DUF2997 domain-containing protein [Clostridia bacterium]|jgi:hypothetical protein
MKKVVFTQDEDGNVQIATKGIKGMSCLKETKDLEQALGTPKDIKHTSEYYVQQTAKNKETL